MDITTEIREGMHVVDSEGKEVGRVKDFQAGDPDSLTAGVDDTADGVLGGSVGVLMDADVSREEAERLSHSGWVRIHKGLFSHDRFLPADELDRIDDDKLWLKPGITLK